MSAPLSVEGGRVAQPSTTLDARVAAVLGWRAWKEKRGEYSLCVVAAPGDREPWKKSRTPDPERYTAVTCELAATIGFFGTGFPKFSTDLAATPLALARMREIAPPEKQTLRLVVYPYSRTYAAFSTDPDDDAYAEGNGEHATTLAISRAILAALSSREPTP